MRVKFLKDFFLNLTLTKFPKSALTRSFTLKCYYPLLPFTLNRTIPYDLLRETHLVVKIKNHSLRSFIRLRFGKFAGKSEAIVYSFVPAGSRCVITITIQESKTFFSIKVEDFSEKYIQVCILN